MIKILANLKILSKFLFTKSASRKGKNEKNINKEFIEFKFILDGRQWIISKLYECRNDKVGNLNNVIYFQ